MFNFGLYHWRRRLRRLLTGLLAIGAGFALRRLARRRRLCDLISLLLVGWGTRTTAQTLRKVLSSPPWHLDREKYDALAAMLPLESAETVLDVGSGTGRSVVGLAPTIDPGTRVIAFDVFDDRIILGNGPGLVRRNAAQAGLDVDPVRGDAPHLPFATDSVDVLTFSRVLHDLSKAEAQAALTDARRVCDRDGTVGVLELPFPHDEGVSPARYWYDLLVDAGFTVTDQRSLDESYFLYAATPNPPSRNPR
ncbi:class I SAM-dependent methyltransferase [Halomarina rubra]|uniref:Class I SAM-dependent methyltransferase n=1 Tax=Halomarina rubra TaxID=2071873 RepID=A0ABD6AWL5_9EURY|nr:methyltransferase domain-containing protein [Halomarina rubra]